MSKSLARWRALPALLLGALGAGTLLAAAIAPAESAAAWPALSRMGLLSALAWLLAGSALAVPMNHAGRSRMSVVAGSLLIAIGAYTLIAVALGHNETRILRPLFAALPAGDRLLLWPGRVSVPVAIALCSGGLTLALLPLWNHAKASLPLQALIALTGLASLVGYLICLTGFASLYRLHPQVAVVRWPAASGILLLALGLGFAATRHSSIRNYYQDRQDRQVLALSGTLLIVLLLTAWSLGVGMLTREWVANSERSMLSTARAEAALLESQIAHHTVEAQELLALSGMPDAAALHLGRQRESALEVAAKKIIEFGGHARVLGVRIEGAAGDIGSWGYSPASQTGPFVPLLHPPGGGLLVGGSIVLRLRIPLGDSNLGDAFAVIDAALADELDRGALATENLRQSRFNLCKPVEPLQGCFRYESSRWTDAPELAARLASPMETGSSLQSLQTYRPTHNGEWVLAQAPLGTSGLSVVIEAPVRSFLLPLRAQLAWAIAALLASAALGMGLIYLKTRRIVQRLLHTRQELSAILEHAPEAIILADAEGRILRGNRGAEALLGIPSSELAGRAFEPMVARVAAKSAGSGQAMLKRTDGRQLTVTLVESAFATETGRRRLFIVRDISDQVKIQEERELWTRVFEHAGWGVTLVSAENRAILLANPAFASMHGYRLEELVGTPIDGLRIAKNPPDASADAPVETAGGSATIETVQRRKDGSHFPALVNATPIFDDHGALLYRAFSVQDISPIKAAEAALQRSETLLRTVLEALPVGVWVTDATGRIVHGNTAGKLIWGGARYVGVDGYGEFRGWWANTGKRIGSAEWALARAVTRGEKSLGEVINIEAFDGAFKTISNSAIPLIDSDGKIEGAIVVNEDITAQVRATEDLRISKELFQTIVGSASVGLALCDPEGRLLLANEALCRILGYSNAEIMERRLLDLTHPADLNASKEMMERALSGEIQTYQIEKRYVHREGHPVWSLLAVALVRGSDDRPKYFIAQVVDITARKLAEDRLRASEARLAHAQSIARLGDWDWELGEGAIRWSDEARAILGEDGRMSSLLDLARSPVMHPDDQAMLHACIRSALAGETRLGVDFRILDTKQEARILHLQGEILRDAEGNAERAIGTIQDVTASKTIETELRASREQMRALSAHLEHAREEERKQIALEVHDELGQLLTGLRMNLSLLRLTQKDRREASKRLEEMRQLVDKTLAVARNLVANLRPTALNFGLVPGLEWLVAEFRHHNAIACNFETNERDLAPNDALATLFFRVAQEALTNVTRHSHARNCVVRLYSGDETLKLEIRDDGYGFDLERALSGKTYGLLGMRERAHRYDCILNVDTAPGEGTIVTIVHSRSAS